MIVADTFGRPWREGLVNVAIGVAGLRSLQTFLGVPDAHGYTLQATILAVADELAGAAELVMGKLDQVPVAVVRGYRYEPGRGLGARAPARPEHGPVPVASPTERRRSPAHAASSSRRRSPAPAWYASPGHEPARRARGPLLHLPAAPGALLDLVSLPRGGRARQAGRVPASGTGPPLRQPSQQPDRLAPRRAVAPAEGPLPRQRVALPEPDPRRASWSAAGAIAVLPAPGEPRPAGPQRRDVRRVPSRRSRRATCSRSIPRAPPTPRPASSASRPARLGSRSTTRPRERRPVRGRTRSRRSSLIPVGLSFEARKSFRGRVLVAFGEPVPLGLHVARAREEPVAAVQSLTDAIQSAMEAEVVHVDRIDVAEVVRAIEDLYRDELVRQLRAERGLPPEAIDVFRLSRAIVEAVAHFREHDPDRVAETLAADPALPRAARRVARARPGGGSPAPGGRASPPPALVGRGRARPPGLPLRAPS